MLAGEGLRVSPFITVFYEGPGVAGPCGLGAGTRDLTMSPTQHCLHSILSCRLRVPGPRQLRAFGGFCGEMGSGSAGFLVQTSWEP